MGVPRAAMPKARASALGLSAVSWPRRFRVPPSRRPLPVTPLRTGTQVQLRQGVPRQPHPRLPRGTGRPGGRTQQGGLGVSWTQALLRCSEAAGGAGPQPRGRAGSGPARPAQACTRSWDSLGHSFSPQDAAEPAARGKRPSSAERQTRSSRCSRQGPGSEATRSRAAVREGRWAEGHPSCHRVLLLTRGPPKAWGPSGAGGAATSGSAGREVTSVAIVIVPIAAVICRARGSNHEG